jgi:hypothetical protein
MPGRFGDFSGVYAAGAGRFVHDFVGVLTDLSMAATPREWSWLHDPLCDPLTVRDSSASRPPPA